MPNNQVQLRRGTTAENNAFTGADGEITFDTDLDRARTHDGSTAGGFSIPNHKDVQNSAMVAGAAGGTANALTLTLAPAPTAYATYQRFIFKASSSNTGAATLNVNSLGAKAIKRLVDGTLRALIAADITSGRVYEAIYDGTQFVLVGGPSRFTSAAISSPTLASGDQTYSAAHGFPQAPFEAWAELVCTTTDLGYAVGRRVPLGDVIKFSSASAWRGASVSWDATNVYAVQEDGLWLPDLSSNNLPTTITYSSWELVLKAVQ